jgi:hypothetical protein
MDNALLLILIIMGNLTIYWVFFGKKKFEKKMEKEANNSGRQNNSY